MELELSKSFLSENNPDLKIVVTVNCQEITIEDNEDREYRKSITLTLNDLEKTLHIYNAFLAAKEATGHDLDKVKGWGNE